MVTQATKAYGEDIPEAEPCWWTSSRVGWMGTLQVCPGDNDKDLV